MDRRGESLLSGVASLSLIREANLAEGVRIFMVHLVRPLERLERSVRLPQREQHLRSDAMGLRVSAAHPERPGEGDVSLFEAAVLVQRQGVVFVRFSRG